MIILVLKNMIFSSDYAALNALISYHSNGILPLVTCVGGVAAGEGGVWPRFLKLIINTIMACI